MALEDLVGTEWGVCWKLCSDVTGDLLDGDRVVFIESEISECSLDTFRNISWESLEATHTKVNRPTIRATLWCG